MTIPDRDVFAALRPDWVRRPEDVWKTSPVHVEGLHADAARNILGGIAEAEAIRGTDPIGLVIKGQPGSGKTHLLGWVREQTHRNGGYFFLVGPLSGTVFWDKVAGTMREDLLREIPGQGTQLAVFLRRLSSLIGVSEVVRDSVSGDAEFDQFHLKNFIDDFRDAYERLGREVQHTLRALVLYGSHDYEAQDVGQAYLQSMEENVPGERATRGMHPAPKPAMEIVRDISRLMALTGPSVMAIDQIDTIVAETTTIEDEDGSFVRRTGAVFDRVADGLLGLGEVTERTLCLVACIPNTWDLIYEKAVRSVGDRFRALTTLGRIDTPSVGLAIIAKRFEERFRKIGYQAPYPTWPVRESAFSNAPSHTPRSLLQRIDRHLERCLSTGEFRELATLLEEGEEIKEIAVVDVRGGRNGVDDNSRTKVLGEGLNARFEELRAGIDMANELNAATEDAVVPPLLAAGMEAWAMECGKAGSAFSWDPPPGAKPALHARLKETVDENIGDERHWSFRAVLSTHGGAALTRIRAACTESGIARGGERRRLFLLRNDDWGKGERTREALDAFREAGGVTLRFEEDDVKTFHALRTMISEDPPGLREWLMSRKPAGGTKLLGAALGDAVPPAPVEPPGPTVARGVVDPVGEPGVDEPEFSPLRFTLGVTTEGRKPVRVELESLRRHTVIFAGSGSGKTVLIRRLVEECALRGVSSVVLDPNNDLARLGDPWPEAPRGWGAADAGLAGEYLANTDVVIWTPRIAGGRPLSFQPLPDFRGVIDEPDELAVMLDAAAATLAVRAKVVGNTSRATRCQAILRQALDYFARRGRTGLAGFIELLSDLPDGLTGLDPQDRFAKEMAHTLEAAAVIDPLFGGHGEPVHAGVLLSPSPGRRARVSVISLIGLPGDEQRQSFVNQLQLELFSWAKKNPAGDRPLGGLFVMDEAQTFAPSGATTPCTASTLALASQARKYGLGLVFATQAPKGLHNRIPGNATTQLFGLLNAPAHIEAAKGMAKVKGGEAPDIGKLGVGQFYAAGENFSFDKIQTPLCLTHHPKSPLNAEEVVERALRGRWDRQPYETSWARLRG
jgi:hypothetical protein